MKKQYSSSFLFPPFLKKGDTVVILSTARKISHQEIEKAVEIFRQWGLQVLIGETIGQEYHQFAGTTSFRANELQKYVNDPNVRAIICARGGYGTVHLLDLIDFSYFSRYPKWIVGFSDVTALHSHINTRLRIQTIHGVMPIQIHSGTHKDSLQTLKNALFGKENKIQYRPKQKHLIKAGKIQAPVLGGNLSVLYSLSGTCSQFNAREFILFLEDVDEYLYHIDRMMQNLMRSGQLKGIKGLILGGFTQIKDNTVPYGSTAEEIITSYFSSMNIPVAVDFPAGHTYRNVALVMGKKAMLEITREGTVCFIQ